VPTLDQRQAGAEGVAGADHATAGQRLGDPLVPEGVQRRVRLLVVAEQRQDGGELECGDVAGAEGLPPEAGAEGAQ